MIFLKLIIFLYFQPQMQKNLSLFYLNYFLVYSSLSFYYRKLLFAASPTIHKKHPNRNGYYPCKKYDKKPVARNIQDSAYDALVEEQINVDQQATYNHIITEIVSESGVQNDSEISVSFEPSFRKSRFSRNNRMEK